MPNSLIDPNDAAMLLAAAWTYIQPYLAKAQEKFVVDNLAGMPGKLWEAIRNRMQGTPAEESLAKLEHDPTNPTNQDSLREELLRLLQYNSEFRQQIAAILQPGDSYSHNTQMAGDTKGSVLQSVGNQNKVSQG